MSSQAWNQAWHCGCGWWLSQRHPRARRLSQISASLHKLFLLPQSVMSNVSTSFKTYLKQYYPCKVFPAASSLTFVSTFPFSFLLAAIPYLCPSVYYCIGYVDVLVCFFLQPASVILTKCAIESMLNE